ncbi:MAG: hypothetical protein AAFY56_07845 [Pseudomonadota bacterium]
MIAEVVSEFDLDRAIVEQFGWAGSADFVHLVVPGPGEEHD